MNRLKILDWGKETREVDFVGYNNARTTCYIVNENHERRAIDLWLPAGYGLKFTDNQIPTQPPDEICRSVLCLPSFEPSLEVDEEFRLAFLEAKSLDKSIPAKDPVPLRPLHPRDPANWDTPDLDKKLTEALSEELQQRRDKFAAIERQISKLPVEEAKTARIHCLPFPEEIARDEATTLDDVKQGKFGLRARLLQQEFIEHHQLDPKRMETDYIQFCGWIRLEAEGFAEHNLEKIAKRVRYMIHFTDNTGCWLEGIQERALTSPQEIEEFQMLVAAPKHNAPTSGNDDHKAIELLAEAQQMLSDGIMLNVGSLVDKMTPQERLLFNHLVAKNPNRPGWAMSYRQIGKRLNVSQTEVQRRRVTLEGKFGRDITRFIAEARAKHEKGVNPDQCDSGHKVKTENASPDTPME